jgi:hypothetical protein
MLAHLPHAMTILGRFGASFGPSVEDFRPCRRVKAKTHSELMEHLTAFDAIFLEVEDSDPHVNLAIAGASIVAGPR